MLFRSVSQSRYEEQIWDVSDITNAKKIVNKASGAQFSFGYTTNSPYFNNEFVAFKNSSSFEPLFVEKVDNQDLSGLKNTEYLIIASLSATPIAKAPPLPPSPITTEIVVVFRLLSSNKFTAIASL